MPGSAGHYSDVPKIAVRLSDDEITVLCNCINETLDSLDDADLADRVGTDRLHARALLGRLNEKRTDVRRLTADSA